MLTEALETGAEIDRVFVLQSDTDSIRLAEAAAVRLETVSGSVLGRLTDTVHPRGPVAVLCIPEWAPLERRATVVLHGVSDPGNVGNLIRTAGALGYAVAISGGTADIWAPKVLRSAAGGHFHTPLTSVADPDAELTAAGLALVALVASGGRPPSRAEPYGPIALIVGSEADGLPDGLVGACEYRVTIAMQPGIGSLNASVAGAIAMYALQSP